MLRDERNRVIEAKGFTEADSDPVFLRAVDGLVQASVLMDGFFRHLVETGGPVSNKGRTRRAVEGWSRAADRVAKFASMLGLEKRSRPVKSITEWLADPQRVWNALGSCRGLHVG